MLLNVDAASDDLVRSNRVRGERNVTGADKNGAKWGSFEQQQYLLKQEEEANSTSDALAAAEGRGGEQD